MRAGIACVCLVVASCSSVPPIEDATGGIPISSIVRRVKCEMAVAFRNRVQEPRLLWLSDWTAKMDLTLDANAEGTIAPNVSWIEKVPLGTFTFGAGVSLNEQAQRTEVMTFSLSLHELKVWYETDRPSCEALSRQGLVGGLGLKEWIDAAVEPVGSELEAGDHPPPDRGGAGAGPKRGKKTGDIENPPEVAASQAVAKQAAADAKKNAEKAQKQARDVSSKLRELDRRNVQYKWVLARSYKITADMARKQTAEVKTLANNAIDYAGKASAANDKAQAIPSASTQRSDKLMAMDAAEDAKANALNAANNARAAASLAKTAADNIPRKAYPPFDSISHSVQFTVKYGASLAPSWSLVEFKGPNGNLFIAQATRTHTLNIVLGPRGDDTLSSNEHDRALTIMAIRQSRPLGTAQ